jgi:hypothetical protein
MGNRFDPTVKNTFVDNHPVFVWTTLADLKSCSRRLNQSVVDYEFRIGLPNSTQLAFVQCVCHTAMIAGLIRYVNGLSSLYFGKVCQRTLAEDIELPSFLGAG